MAMMRTAEAAQAAASQALSLQTVIALKRLTLTLAHKITPTTPRMTLRWHRLHIRYLANSETATTKSTLPHKTKLTSEMSAGTRITLLCVIFSKRRIRSLRYTRINRTPSKKGEMLMLTLKVEVEIPQEVPLLVGVAEDRVNLI